MELLGVDIRTIILAIVTVINGMLGSLLYIRNKSKSSLFFIVALFATAAWSFGIMFYTQPGITSFTKIFSNFNYTVSSVIAVAFFFFAYYFGTENKTVSKRFQIFTILFLLLVFFFISIPNKQLAVIGDFELINNSIKKEIYGLGYIFYLTLLFGYFTGGIIILIKKFLKSEGMFRKQLIFILLGTGIAIIQGIITNVVFPNMGIYGYEWIGPVGTLVMASLIFYAISKHKLWDFRVVAIQVFIALMVLTMLLQVFVARNLFEKIIRVSIFIIVFALGIFIIKNILKEVEDKEKMKKLAEELEQANKRLETIDVEKSDFVSITSHQFRTPLTIIKGYASMLLEGSFGQIKNKAQKDVIEKIYQASQRLVLTIEEFLNISKIERNQMSYFPKKTDLRKLISEVIKDFSKTIEDEGLKIEFNAPLSENFFVKIDPDKTKLVFSNIIDNSIKYTPRGGKISITLKKEPRNKTILMKIQDTGIGIKKELLFRLFEKFSRGPEIFKLHTEGRGLGLYVAKKIINAQGGKIWAESEGENKGSTFYIEFPDFEYEKNRKEIKDFVEALQY